MENTSIQPKKVIQSIEENLKALRDINYDDLTKEEREELKIQLLELQEIALSIKNNH